MDFTNLRSYDLQYILTENGIPIYNNVINIDINPRATKDIKLALPKLQNDSTIEYYLNLYVKTNAVSATSLVPIGHVIASEQLKMSGNYFAPRALEKAVLEVKIEKNIVSFRLIDFLVILRN